MLSEIFVEQMWKPSLQRLKSYSVSGDPDTVELYGKKIHEDSLKMHEVSFCSVSIETALGISAQAKKAAFLM